MRSRKPYRIELVGVVCDAYLAVVRGIRRAVITERAVRVKSQLQSHKRFATAFHGYCGVVDNARLYSTNSMGGRRIGQQEVGARRGCRSSPWRSSQTGSLRLPAR
ncbi:hypothetical protein QYE76_001348 [Lolium multiflorum]|uniref:Uncharacterized protein n=1 Tax=Lolium multiflorum TaxID=4521 RepID=A0AAD8VZA0_LOLMU|nr:hypothetical protein QYE76_001348 [Lolium multiflorum]